MLSAPGHKLVSFAYVARRLPDDHRDQSQEIRESPSGDRDLDARGEVLRLLDVLGFAPDEQPDGRVRLTHCPLLDAARRHPAIVCRVHDGLIKGALESFGDVGTAATLHPFAEPGACTLDLDRE